MSNLKTMKETVAECKEVLDRVNAAPIEVRIAAAKSYLSALELYFAIVKDGIKNKLEESK